MVILETGDFLKFRQEAHGSRGDGEHRHNTGAAHDHDAARRSITW